ncbi:putative uncharacterized protein [Moritella viscosa]|nr:putative uncharacterized protein [Moritella viscosa]
MRQALCFRGSMNARIIDIILSISLGLLVIYASHNFLIVDSCLDMGGAIDQKTGSCFDENYHELYMVVTPALTAIYFVIGLLVSLLSIFTIKRIKRTKGA